MNKNSVLQAFKSLTRENETCVIFSSHVKFTNGTQGAHQ